MGSEAPKSVVVHVTGFKKFQGVVQNPTETIVNKLNDYVEKRGLPAGVTLGSCTVLETAGDGAVTMLYKTLESNTIATNAEKNEQVVWLHLGVNSGAVKFAIERCAVNEATFRCPDEMGWQPQNHPIISEDGEITCLRQTWCPVDGIFIYLKKKGFDATISDDAGRYVCNYVYYHSLKFAQQKGHKSLFVHVPLFSRIDEETQMEFVASVVEAIGSTC
ncbi:Pyrrolidone-carboxylate peptidase [Linum grandiflorum]